MNRFTFFVHSVLQVLMAGALLAGCAGTPDGQVKLKGEGSGGSIPPPGTQVMILSNHKGVLNKTTQWFYDQGLTVIDQSRVEKELRDSAAQQAVGGGSLQIMNVARAVEADLVVSSYVGRKYVPGKRGSGAMTIATVEVQGMKVQDGTVAFESKAWNSDPVAESEDIILNLASTALEQIVHGEKAPAAPPLMVVAKEQPRIASETAPSAESAQEGEQSESSAEHPDQLPHTRTIEEGAPIPEEEPPAQEEEASMGLKLASGALSILYTPAKLVYAGLGGIFGGLAYVTTGGNAKASQSIWDASIKGTYWLTPDHLQGREQVHFKGKSGADE
jgi:hypothetical protein